MTTPLLLLLAAAVAVLLAFKLHTRLRLSMAKHKSLAGHSKMSRRVAKLIPFYDFSVADFFNSDRAPAEVERKRMEAFFRLAADCKQRFAKSRQLTADVATGVSDLQFVETYRVPFQYSRLVRENLGAGAFVEASSGVTVTDPDGNVFYDLTGSYGVNIFGNDFYKECMAAGEARGRALGPVLGS
jgi:glutamate-1-semialdehyde 2,1-aminomutase